MAKRGAEALAYRAPWESLLPQAPLPKRPRSDFQRREPLRAAPSTGGEKRKRQEEAEEEKAAGKRPALSEPSRPQEEEKEVEAASTRLLPEVEVEAASGGGRDSDENDVWHYNSFQYWRSPLPTIDLSDILDLEKDDTVEARDSSSIGLSEMET